MAITQETAGAAILGRRLGITAFWLMAVWWVAVCFYSVLGQLFFFNGPVSLSSDGYDCPAKLAELENRLVSDAADVLKSTQRATLERWLHDWDHDFTEAQARCGELSAVSADLKSLRTSMEALLREHQAQHLPVRRRIHQMLEALHPGAKTPTEES